MKITPIRAGLMLKAFLPCLFKLKFTIKMIWNRIRIYNKHFLCYVIFRKYFQRIFAFLNWCPSETVTYIKIKEVSENNFTDKIRSFSNQSEEGEKSNKKETIQRSKNFCIKR